MEERYGVLVVRAWVEGSTPAGLRARITWSSDLTSTERVTTATTSVQEILAEVRKWLESLLGDQGVSR